MSPTHISKSADTDFNKGGHQLLHFQSEHLSRDQFPVGSQYLQSGVGSRSCARDYLFLPGLLSAGGGLGDAPGAGLRLCGGKFSYINDDASNRHLTEGADDILEHLQKVLTIFPSSCGRCSGSSIGGYRNSDGLNDSGGLVTGRVYVLHFKTGEQEEVHSSLRRGPGGFRITYQQRSCVSPTHDALGRTGEGGGSPFLWTLASGRGDGRFPGYDRLEVLNATSSLPPFFLRPGHALATSPGPVSGPVRGGSGPVQSQVFPDDNTGGDLNPLLLYARRGLDPQGNGTGAVSQPAGAEFPSARDPAGAEEVVASEDTNFLSTIGNIVSETLQEALPGFGNSLEALLGGTIVGRGADADQAGLHTSTTRQAGRRSHAASVTSKTAQVKKYKGSSYGDSFIISLLPRSSGRLQPGGGERNQSSIDTIRVAATDTPATRANTEDSPAVSGAPEPAKHGTKFESAVNSMNKSQEVNNTMSGLRDNSSLSNNVSHVQNFTRKHPGPEMKEEGEDNTNTGGLMDKTSTSGNVTGKLDPVESNLLLSDATDSYLEPNPDRGRLNARLSDPAAQALHKKPTAVKNFPKFSGEGSLAVSPYLTSLSTEDDERDDNEGSEDGETSATSSSSSSSLHLDSSFSPTPLAFASLPPGSSPSSSEPPAPPPSSLSSRIPSSTLTLSDPMKKEAVVRHVPDSKASDTFIISLVSELLKTATGEGGRGADIDSSTTSPQLVPADEDVGRTVDLGDSDDRGTGETRMRRNVVVEDPYKDREGRVGDLVTWYPDTFRYDYNWITRAPFLGGHLAKPPRPADVNKDQLIVRKVLDKVVTRRQPFITVTSRPYYVLPDQAYEKLFILRDKLKKSKTRDEDTGASILQKDTRHASTSSSFALESGGGSNGLVTWRPYLEEVFQDTDEDQSKPLVTWSSVQDS
ncbi:uncharacterized protein [Panulirus ornatus]|uniref:uncharacterized protein n=1 Tax=Panulirus ornatus TaxID=150431 RepID=UPI003A85440E